MPDAALKTQDYFKESRENFGYAQQTLFYHWARLIEILACAECAADALKGDLSRDKFPDSL